MKKSKRSPLSRHLLQTTIAIGGLVPVGAGMAGILMGTAMIGGPGRFFVPLDSHYRYLSGLLLGIGLGFWSCIPEIEKQGTRFRLLTAIVVTGGLGRLVSLCTLGLPDTPMRLALGMELIVAPLLMLWQWRISTSSHKKS